MGKITPYLWFDTQAEEAIDFYCSIFSDSRIISVSRYGEGAPLPAGTLLSATFELDGQQFIALNGGPHFKFNEAVSFFIKCETQSEIDNMWSRLTENGGVESRCGWLKDRFGVSWQVVPPILGEYFNDSDQEKVGRVMQAMLKMNKLIIADLTAAYNGE